MDHLPMVIDPHEPIDIPYLGGPQYNGLDFAGYPARQGWRLDLLQEGDYCQGRDPVEAAQFLQTWLYFGMLYEALIFSESDYINLEDFIRIDEDSQQKYITTARLPELFSTWHQHAKQLPNIGDCHDRFRYYGRFRNSMKLACGVWWDLMERSKDDNSAFQLLSHEILLSIQILGAALDIGVTAVCCGDYSDYTWRTVPRPTWLMQRMIKQGWCPCVVEQLSKPCATFLYYASLLGPQRRADDHTACVMGGRACVAANVKDGEKYVSKHVVDCSGCDYVTIATGDGSKVATAIEKGEIPVIHLRVEGESLEINIRSYSQQESILYTAISHVWSDGLGDPLGNGLPRCQLKRLASLLSSLPPYPETAETEKTILPTKTKVSDEASNCFFWMDTLCVPVNNTSLRQQAINRMRDVYKRASNVLVLTEELMQCSSIGKSYTEIFTRITCSTWLRRLWTLQEATLNRNLLFQFADRALYAGSRSALYHTRARDNVERPWDLVAWECNRYVFNFLDVFPYFNYAERLSTVWDALEYRTTSRENDEPLCIAMLLELNVDALQKEPDACSVRKFWRLHEEDRLPAQILFVPGPKLQVKGLRWAPRNLRDLAIIGVDIKSHAAVTPRGLCARYPSFVLEPLRHAVQAVIACEVDDCTFFIRQNFTKNTLPWKRLKLHERPKLAVILQVLVKSETEAAGGFEAGLGALVSKVSGGEERYAMYLRFVSVVKKDSFLDKHPRVPWSNTELEEKEREPIRGVYLPVEQKWCLR